MQPAPKGFARPPSAPLTARPTRRVGSAPRSRRYAAPASAQRQRAIYSEALVPRAPAAEEEVQVNLNATAPARHPSARSPLAGPSNAREIRSAREARPVSANSFSQRYRPQRPPDHKPPPGFADVEPKVCEAFLVPAGRPPRRVRVERLRRLYESQDIEELLLARNVNYANPAYDLDCKLPLEEFDDTEYDSRSPQEWLTLAGVWEAAAADSKPLSAKALLKLADGSSVWRRALVQAYLAEGRLFQVTWAEPELEDLGVQFLPRLSVLLDAEDPRAFAERVANAHVARRTAEALIRYNFYIDNMPTDEVLQLNPDQAQRILGNALGARRPKDVQAEDSAWWDEKVEAVLQEVQLDFARTMNRITFDVHLATNPPNDPMHAGLELAADRSVVARTFRGLAKQDVPKEALVAVPHSGSFADSFAAFCFETLRVRAEVVLALVGIQGACLKIEEQECVFALDFRKALRLEEFRQVQRAAAAHTTFQLREVWTASLHQTVLREFSSVGKGWFNIQETSLDLYKRGKLRRFLQLVRFVMEATLRNVAERSVSALVAEVDRVAPARVEVSSLSEGGSAFKVDGSPDSSLPMFMVDVMRKEGVDGGPRTLVLSMEPRKFSTTMMEVFDRGLGALREVQSLEHLVMPQLTKAEAISQPLAAVDSKEPWVVEARQHLEERVGATLPSLEAYLAMFHQYEGLLNSDPSADVLAFMEGHDGRGEPSDDEIHEAIQSEKSSLQRLLWSVPDVTQVGLFLVGCKEVRRQLASVHEAIIQLLLEALMRRMRDHRDETLDGFAGLGAQLRRAPKDVEELVEMRRFAERAPRQIAQLEERMTQDIRLYDRLERCFHKISTEDVRRRWALVAAPRIATDLVAHTLRRLQRDEAYFLQQLISQQDEFVENLDEIDSTIDLFRRNGDYRDKERYVEIVEAAENVSERIRTAATTAQLLNSREALLGRPCTDYTRLQRSSQAFEPFGRLWTVVNSWLTHRDSWRHGSLLQVDAAALAEEVCNGAKQLKGVCEAFQDDPGQASMLEIAAETLEELELFRPYVPLVTAMRAEGMGKRHWEEISAIVGQELSPDMVDFTLSTLCSKRYSLLRHQETLQSISERATKEFAVECKLKQMYADWDGVKFDCEEPYRSTGTFVLRGEEEVIALLDEQLVAAQSLQFSTAKGPWAEDIDAWAAKLRYMTDCLEEWRKCQMLWLYLQPIFDSLDVARQLVAESRRFKAVDSLWRSIMKATHDEPHAFPVLSREGLVERWAEANNSLEAVKRSLEEFLEMKRSKFSRFFFLSNDELLEIISQTKDPTRVQPFLKKVFEGVTRLTFHDDMYVASVASSEGEEVRFPERIPTRDANVEVWMRDVEQQMFSAMRLVLAIAIADFGVREWKLWIMEHPAQVVLAGSQAHWTAHMENLLTEAAQAVHEKPAGTREERKQATIARHCCSDVVEDMEAQLKETVGMLREVGLGRRGTLLSTLVTLSAHQRDIAARLAEARVPGPGAFEWMVQVHHIWKAAESHGSSGPAAPSSLMLRCAQSSFPYGFEYLGVSTRLVMTPLTDKCYMTLLSAQQFHLGGAALGPTGTGKTETVKDFAKAAAKRCIVFNCSEGVNSAMLSRFFKGLSIGGFWVCFDELNRTTVEVLSVAAQQVLALLAAKAEITSWTATKEISFDGAVINVSATFGIFATLTPLAAGRLGLPDSLKSLLRLVVMMVPDSKLVVEGLLLSTGFEFAAELASKIVVALQFSSQLLSAAQPQYDFSLRTAVAVVAYAGALRRAHASYAGKGAVKRMLAKALDPQAEEHHAVFAALRETFAAKLADEDTPLFNDILQDLFPTADRQIATALVHHASALHDSLGDSVGLEAQVSKACKQRGLQPLPAFVGKCAQLHTAMQVRHGVMLLGPTGTGKTNCVQTLLRALNTLSAASGSTGEGPAKVNCHTLNPKAVPRGQLFGYVNPADGEWKDGVAADIVRAAAREGMDERRWINFDGPVDMDWVESLNTLLDDNRRLCLTSGEVIQLTPAMTVMFEADSLQAASPATVSRCGIVFAEPTLITLDCLALSWLEKLPFKLEAQAPKLKQMCEELMHPMVHFVRGPDCNEMVPTTDIGLCMALFGLMDSIFQSYTAPTSQQQQQQQQQQHFMSAAAAVAQRRREPVGGCGGPVTPMSSDRQRSDGAAGPAVGATGTNAGRSPADLIPHLEQFFVFALVWSLGSSCDSASRIRFSTRMKEVASAAHIPLLGVDSNARLHELRYRAEEVSWAPWYDASACVPVGALETYGSIVVPTVDSVRLEWLLSSLLTGGRHVVCTGPVGTGKSSAVARVLNNHLADGRMIIAHLVMSSRTQPSDIRDLMDARLDKRRRGVYGPPAGKRCAFFLDDLNMPRQERFGAQPPLELLRHWLDYGGWHRAQERMFCQIVDVLVAACMGLPGGGRQSMSARVARHLHVLGVPDLEEDSVTTILLGLVSRGSKANQSPVAEAVDSLVEETAAVFRIVREKLLPTPQKVQYNFSFRDLWRAFQGFCGLAWGKDSTPEQVARGWCHELLRELGDRIMCPDDANSLKATLLEACSRSLEVTELDVFPRQPLMFSRISQTAWGAKSQDLGKYAEVENLDGFQDAISAVAADLHLARLGPVLVTFREVCVHVARLCRVMETPGGSSLLVGHSGCGKQSVARLAAHAMGQGCFEVSSSARFALCDWHRDLKTCLMRAGVEGSTQRVLLSDAQIASDDVLEDICSVLLSGDTPNLYNPEDVDVIMKACTGPCQEQQLETTRANVFAVYVQRVRAKLHAILAMSPAKASVQRRLRSFPALLSCFVLDWVQEWQQEAYVAVAARYLSPGGPAAMSGSPATVGGFLRCSSQASAVSQDQEPASMDFSAAVPALPAVHEAGLGAAQRFAVEAGRHCYRVLPKVFVELLYLMASIARGLRSEREKVAQRLDVSISRLEECAQQVGLMQLVVNELAPKLLTSAEEDREMAEHLEAEKAEAEASRQLVAQAEESAQQQADVCQARGREASEDLYQAMPALEQAVASIRQLKEAHIREIKSMTHPPANVIVLMSAVCIMFGLPPAKRPGPTKGSTVDDYMLAAQHSLLNHPKKMLEDLIAFDKEHIDESKIEQLKPLFERGELDPAIMRRTSQACEVICIWLRTMFDFHFVNKQVQPKRDNLRHAQAALDAAKQALSHAQVQHKAANEAVQHLESELAMVRERQERLDQQNKECHTKMERAEKLTAVFGEQRRAWAVLLGKLRRRQALLTGDSVLCAAMVTYTAPLGAAARKDLTLKLVRCLKDCGIDHTHTEDDSPISLQQLINDTTKFQDWHQFGLLHDNFYVENGIIMDTSRRWPMMLDPQQIGTQFVKRIGRSSAHNGLEVCAAADATLLRVLEVAVELGKWVLIEQVGQGLHPGLDQLLARNKTRRSPGWEVKVGDKAVPWNDGFRLFMATMNASPPFTADFCATVLLVDFSLTVEGLEEQLLSLVITREGPELERHKVEQVDLGARMRRELARTEEATLQLLADSDGNILEDEQLTRALVSSQESADQLNLDVQMAESSEGEIDVARQAFLPTARRIARLYLVTASLASVDPMYQFSLRWFSGLVSASSGHAWRTANFEERMTSLRNMLVQKLFRAMACAISEEYRVLFALCVTLRLQEGSHETRDLKFLAQGSASLREAGVSPKTLKAPSFLPSDQWTEVCALSQLPNFNGVESAMVLGEQDWRRVYLAPDAWDVPFPAPWEQRLSVVQKLCVLRAIRPDCIERGISRLASTELGSACVDAFPPSLQECWQASTNLTPLIFLLSDGGEDPASRVFALSRELRLERPVDALCLTEAHGARAKRLLEDAAEHGGWVLLCNCHMLPKWMPELERVFDSFDADMTHRDFRLWLTTARSSAFPLSMLQAGCKISVSPPLALRTSLIKAYTDLEERALDSTRKPEVHRRLVFGLSFFHAIVTERVRFGPTGFASSCTFLPEDMRVSRRQMRALLDQASDSGREVPFQAIQHIVADIHYGGRVTEEQDKKLLEVLARRCLCRPLVEDPSYRLGAARAPAATSMSGLKCPQAETREEFLDSIRRFPSYAAAEVFGLHDNVLAAYQEKQGLGLLAGMKTFGVIERSSQQAEARGDVEISDKELLSMARQLLAGIPDVPDLASAKQRFPQSYKRCMNAVLHQEVGRYGHLVRVMASSLKALQASLQGFRCPDDQLDALSECLRRGTVPQAWADAGYASKKPLASWLEDLAQRLRFVEDWATHGQPAVFWMSGLCIPHSLTTAVLQDHARRRTHPIDTLEFSHEVLKTMGKDREGTTPPDEGCYIHGLFLEGCRWCREETTLTHAFPRELVTELPIIWFFPTQVGHGRKPPKGYRYYAAPLYKVPSRGGVVDMTGCSPNLVLSVHLLSTSDTAVWLLAGVALLLSLAQ